MMKMPRRRRLPPGFWPVPLQGHKQRLLPVWWALAAALIAALVMPRQSPFPYRFEKGQPWNYPALKAPFDFEVLHPEELVREELNRVENEHAPYFLLRSELGRQQKRRLEELLNGQTRISRNDAQYEDLVRNPAAYLNFGQGILQYLYDRGIGGTELENLLKDNPGAQLYLVNGNTETKIQAGNLFTLHSAQNFLTDTLPYSPLRQPELLLPILEQVLVPNVIYDDSTTNAMKRRKIAAVVSTGITVRKGEEIVRKNDLITEEIYRKLDSLSQRFDLPNSFRMVAGYAILSFFAFGLFFFWYRETQPGLWQKRETALLPAVLVLCLLLLISFSAWIGYVVPLLLPLWALPLLLQRFYPARVSWATWILLLLLSTVSLDWSAGWLLIQMTGAAAMVVLPHFQGEDSWARRAILTAATATLQTAVWLAAILAGKIPIALQTIDVALFLLAANGLTLLFFLFRSALQEEE